MKNIIQTLIKYTIWAFIFAATSYVYATGTWTEPASAPTGGNTDTPINVSATAQTKTGNLGASQFCDENNANCIKAKSIISTSTTAQTKLGSLTTTGFSSLTDAYFATDISVGTVTDPTSLSLVGLFNGNVGATKYCGTTGTNCIKTSNPQTIFLPYTDRYTKTTTFTTTSGVSSYDGNMDISASTLKSNISSLSGETRDIAGIIVAYDLTMGIHSNPSAGQVSGTSGAKDMWYIFGIGNQLDSQLNHLYYEDITPFYYDESSIAISGSVSGTVVIYDTVTADNFKIMYRINRNAAANLTGSMALQLKATVIGYILN